MRLNLSDQRVVELLELYGVPYSFGAGKPSDAAGDWPPPLPKGSRGGAGYDCSGFVQVALVHLGLLPVKAPDRCAAALWDAAMVLPIQEARLGDMAFYGSARVSHVMLCLGDGVVMGARGGYSVTNGDDPDAYVDLEPIRYRKDLRGVRRMPPLMRDAK